MKTINSFANVYVTSQTASRIASIGSDKSVTSLDTSTYPSLAELAYVKGVTSAIQTQLGSKYGSGASPSFAAITVTASPVSITQTTTTGRAVTILRNLASASTDSPIFLVNNQNSGDDNAAAWFETSVAAQSPVQLVQNSVTSTNFKKYISLGGNAIWASNGTTPNGALSGTAGDICIGADSGNAYKCTTGTTWVAL